MNSHSANSGNVKPTTLFAGTRELLETGIKSLNKEELENLIYFLDAVNASFKTREDVFKQYGDDVRDLKDAFEFISTTGNSDNDNISIQAGKEIMVLLYDKVKAFVLPDNNMKQFVTYIYSNAKQTYRRAKNKYSKGGREDVNIPCVPEINDNLVALHVAKDWNAFLKEASHREYDRVK